jgi:hypothetical protein
MYCQKCQKWSGKYPLCKDCYYETEEAGETEIEEEKKDDITEELICPICGEPTFVLYGNARKDKLCREHGKMLKEGLIKYIEGAKKYMDVKTRIILSKDNSTKKETTETDKEEKTDIIAENNVIIINEQDKSKCITCGKHTNGLLFCSDCYRKYNKKELLFKITNCSAVELLDENYEGRYTCKDGHVVKSKSEREIDNYLFEHDIPHAYEKSLPYGKTEKEILHPDFYLPNYLGKGKHVFIEHWGYNENNLQYYKTKKFKMPIYEKLGITLVCTYEKTDTGDIDSALERKLNKENIEENKINYPNG